MKKFLTLALVGAVALGASSVVFANICAYDQVPAATLLFPFVQMDLDNGIDTQFAITNVSSEAQVVHVTVWTDYSVAVLDFNILLTGYDVQTISVSKIFREGWLPQTGTTTTSPTGDVPDADGPVSSANGKDWVELLLAAPEGYSVLDCTEGNPSDYGDGVISSSILTTFLSQLSASKATGARGVDLCNGLAVPTTWWDDDAFNAERPIWMYITADVAARCSTDFPDTPGYFGAGGAGEAFQNVLMGDWFTTDPNTNDSTAMPAVHLEADQDLASVAKLHDAASGLPVSFYARYTGGADFREPLGTAWGFRYMVAPGFTTQVRAFKASTEALIVPDLDASDPSYLIADYCQAYTYYSWDEEEQVKSGSGGTDPFSGGEGQGAPNLLPLETQEVDLNQFNIADDFGWILFVWPQSNYDGLVGQDGSMTDLYQTWMGVHYTAQGPNGMLSEGMSANLMANYNCFSDQVLGNLGINYDYVDEFGYVVPAANATPAF